MSALSDKTGPSGGGKTSWEIRSVSKNYDSSISVKELINKANSIPLTKVIKKYGILLDEINKKIICPFPNHKGGRESTASFYYYPSTNSFYCFGCKTGIYCSDFVAAIESIDRVKAAKKILSSFSDDVDEDNLLDRDNFSERLEIMMNFSSLIREKIHSSNEDEISKLEDITKIYDSLCSKHNLNNDALKALIDRLKVKL